MASHQPSPGTHFASAAAMAIAESPWTGTSDYGIMPVAPSAARPLTPPGKMARPTVTLLNSFAVSVRWTPPADVHSRRTKSVLAAAGQDLPVQGYRLRYLVRDQDDTERKMEYIEVDQMWDVKAKDATLKSLAGGKEYIFQVVAFNSAGLGPWSDPSEPFPMPDDKHAERPSFLSERPDSVEIRWPAICGRGSEIVGYDILCSSDKNFSDELTMPLKIVGDRSKLVVNNLRPNTVYYFKYRAHNKVGASSWSTPTPGVATKSKAPERPDPPIQVGDPSTWRPNELLIKWDPPESFNVPIQHYVVQRSTSPDMADAVEVPIGGDAGKQIEASPDSPTPTADSPAASPSGRRPGYQRGNYALTQLKVKGLRPSTAYYFQVKAINLIGESPWSNPGGPIRTLAAPPECCAKPTLIWGDKNEGLRISWPSPESYGLTITRFDVRHAQQAMMTKSSEVRDVRIFQEPGSDQIEAQLQNCGLLGVDYFCQVRAVSAAGVGDWSEVSEAMQVTPEKPFVPEAPNRFVPLSRAIVVHWTPPDNRGSPITGYQLRYDTNRQMGRPVVVRGVTGTQPEFAVTNLQPHFSYYFQVRAVNAVGVSDWSLPSRPVAVQMVPPTMMAAPTLIRATGTSITIGFVPPCDAGTRDGEMIQHYVLRYAQGDDRFALVSQESRALVSQEEKPSAEGEERPTAAPTGAVCNEHRQAQPSGTEVTGLQPGMMCAFRIYAVNKFGESEPSLTVEYSTTSAPPERPDSPKMSENTSHSITLTMAPPECNGAPVTHYLVEVEDRDSEKRYLTRRFGAEPSNMDGLIYHAVTGLSPGPCYRFRVRAINSEGESEWSDWSDNCFTAPARPKAPGLPSVAEVTPWQFTLTWEPAYSQGTPVTEYKVQYTMDEDLTRGFKELLTTECLAECKDCKPGVNVYVRLAAANIQGYGPFCPVLTVPMKPHAPDAPMRVHIKESGSLHMKICWINPFNCGSEIIALWLRYHETDRDGRPEDQRDRGAIALIGKKRSACIEPLLPRREYIFEVAAINSIGVGPFSQPSAPCRTGDPLCPTEAGKPTFSSSTEDSLTLEWDASDDRGSEILEQILQLSHEANFKSICREVSLPPWEASMALPDPPRQEAAEPATAKGELSATASNAGDVPCDDEAADFTMPTFAVMPAEIADGNGSDGLMEQLARGARKPKRKPKLAQYAVKDLHPGTRYYARVVSRNEMGRGHHGMVSQKLHTDAAIPDRIPQAPGIVLLRGGCTTLTFGFQRPGCHGAPITHYDFRYAESEAALWSDTCCEFQQIEQERPVWPGIVKPPPQIPPIEPLSLEGQDVIGEFVEYIFVRFGSLDDAWEWLDIDASGGISKEEFMEGSVDGGPPFADFKRQDILPAVWQMLDSDGTGSIDTLVWQKLAPYIESVKTGGCAGDNYDGVICLLPGLECGKEYYFMARAVNRMGASEWTECQVDPCRTQPLTPACMEPPVAIAEKRTGSSVTFTWSLPSNNGSPISKLEFRWACGNVEDGLVERLAVHAGQGGSGFITPDPATGMLPSTHEITGLDPGQIVFFVMRAFNEMGGSRAWSPLSRITVGGVVKEYEEVKRMLWEVDNSSLPAVPGKPVAPTFLEETLASKDMKVSGDFRCEVGRNNGPPITSFTFQLFDCKGEQQSVRYEVSVTIMGARGLRNADLEEGSDPYCTCEVQGKWMTKFSTKVIENDLDPVWNYEETITDYRVGDNLMFAVYDRDRGKSDDLLGKAFLPNQFFHPDGFDGEVQLRETGLQDRERSYLRLRIEVIPYLKPLVHEWTEEFNEERAIEIQQKKWERFSINEKMAPGERYSMRCRATNMVGSSDWGECMFPSLKMPPDRPREPQAMLSEFTSLNWIELKWHPPEDNGSPILQYGIRYAYEEFALEEAFHYVDDAELRRSMRPYGQDGRRMSLRDTGTWLFRAMNLSPSTSHWFQYRARNTMGWSDWSKMSRFLTKASRPMKPVAFIKEESEEFDDKPVQSKQRLPTGDAIQLVCAAPRELEIKWTVPESNGSDIYHYDIIGGPNVRVLQWGLLVTAYMEMTVGSEKIFNVDKPSKGELPDYGVVEGQERLADLVFDIGLLVAVRADNSTFKLEHMLPGQNYYFAFRACGGAGQGSFSDLSGPFTTRSEEPHPCEPANLNAATETTAQIAFHLPYNMGSPIQKIAVNWARISGPLSKAEIDEETGECAEQLKGLTFIKQVKDLAVMPDDFTAETVPLPYGGTTEAMLRSYRDEGIDDEKAFKSGHVPTLGWATCRERLADLHGLMPGTRYEVKWACWNGEGRTGWTDWSTPTVFVTEAQRPDTPKPLMFAE